MKLLEAIKHAAAGSEIVSCAGKTYTPGMLAVSSCGRNYAVFNACGMTDIERKGKWTVHNI
ncbi:hypothetical protein [Paenibacillus sp. 1P03SA]|uniref:hypothetical protein n=1 Tax=Paenibacillus sp. 1P03SA TaxID=3132294 RepID=UPI00399F259D